MEHFVLHPWYWLVLALVLIALESAGCGGFMLGAALSGVLMAAVSRLFTLTPQVQALLFGIGAIVFTILWWYFFRRFNRSTGDPLINHRAARLKGRTFVTDHDIPAGESRLQIGDTLWRVQSKQPVRGGQRIEVYDNKELIMMIRENTTP